MSAVVAHELNNIAVPLLGFIDLITGEVITADNARQCLEEVRIGVERITELAFELESLAYETSMPVAMRLSECFTALDSRSTEIPYHAEFLCDPLTRVTVDGGQARRAISSLAHLVGAARLSVADSLPQGAYCAACGAGPLRSRGFVEVRAGNLRPAILLALTNPFDPGHKIRPQQRLVIAALQHAAHLAGGHVLTDAMGEAVSIALPKA